MQARELLAWERPGLPTDSVATDLREQFVKRKRPSFDALWGSQVNVKIGEHWRRALTDEERLRLLPLVKDEAAVEAFPGMTLREFKDAMRMPVAQALGVLAKLEALYWHPVSLPMALLKEAQPLADVRIDGSFVERMNVCVASQWVNDLEPNDLRFPAMTDQKLGVWIASQLGNPVLPGQVHDLCIRLLAADKASWAEELADVVTRAIDYAVPRPGSSDAKQRWTSIFLARYGGLQGLELQAVGNSHGITRERVRQICDAILVALHARPVKMPALERLLVTAERVMPMPMDEANVQLARFLGDGFGLLAAIQFAKVMGMQSPVQHASPMARTHEGYKPVSIVQASATPATWVSAALASARRDCTFVGCTNFIRIAGFLALEQGVAPDLETLRAVFSMAPGFRMLDPDSGWFTLADSESSAVAKRLRKLLSVSMASVDIDTFAAALATDDRWIYREGGRALALPPLHVMTELLSGWSWLSANGHNKYTSKTKINAEDVLSKPELSAIEALEIHGGVATRAELAAHLIEKLRVSDMTVSNVTAMSPALCKIEHAIYGIRGRALPIDSLVQARRRRLAELSDGSCKEEVDLTAPVRVNVNQSSSTVEVSRRVVYLPAYLSGEIVGKFVHRDGTLPEISVKPNQQIRWLAKAAESLGIGAGERFEIIFNLPERTYSIPGRELCQSQQGCIS